mmetsp:Transcript_58868/g.165175  ORF Transcript_58868/g.165175 Transcript_58868/m.165175 type:complete len:262 (-) Transcript_58868:102-887(-)
MHGGNGIFVDRGEASADDFPSRLSPRLPPLGDRALRSTGPPSARRAAPAPLVVAAIRRRLERLGLVVGAAGGGSVARAAMLRQAIGAGWCTAVQGVRVAATEESDSSSKPSLSFAAAASPTNSPVCGGPWVSTSIETSSSRPAASSESLRSTGKSSCTARRTSCGGEDASVSSMTKSRVLSTEHAATAAAGGGVATGDATVRKSGVTESPTAAQGAMPRCRSSPATSPAMWRGGNATALSARPASTVFTDAPPAPSPRLLR